MMLLQAIWAVLLELAPWLMLGAGVAGLVHGLLPRDFVGRHLSGRAGVAKAVMVGVPLPLCSCGVIPAGLGLKKDGASDGAAVGFLVSTPQTGVDSILVAAGMLGWPFALFKVGAAAVTGLAGGWITDALGGAPGGAGARAGEAARPGAKEMLSHALEMLQTIWRWLVFGIVVSAALTVFLPPGVFSGLADGGGLVAMLAMLLVSVPLYVCATASVPIAAALVAGGLPLGAALVFLMAGPATNVATIGAVYRAFGKRTLAIYLTTIIVGSVAFGLVFEGLVGGSVSAAVTEHAHATWWAQGAAVVLLGLLARFAWQDARDLLRPKVVPAAGVVSLPVEGLRCNGCVRKLKAALEEEPGVAGVEVTLEPGGVTVHGTLDAAGVQRVVRAVGYAPGEPVSPAISMAVEGMTCNGCARKLRTALESEPGVTGVEVTLEPGGVTVHGALDAEGVERVVRAVGYKPGAAT